jgi:poly-beta-1,6-N-acetyl-D-glucosamine N-deacetylase
MSKWTLFIALLLFTSRAPAQQASYRVLCYHDVQQDVRVHPDPYAVDSGQLVAQFAWLKDNGYHVVSLEDVLAARDGRRPLPTNAILLTFDDGYRSTYTRVFPLLKIFNYPAVIALTGSWLEAAPGKTVTYEDRQVPRENFVSWAEVREMVASGLVEVASHSYALHQGVSANPQGSLIPAAVATQYENGAYETDAAHLSRVKSDLARNSALIEANTGKRPRLMVWPYGAASDQVIEVARELGMPMTMTLRGGANQTEGDVSRIRRELVVRNPPLRDFIALVSKPEPPLPQRVVHVDLDYVYDDDARQQQENFDRLLDRIKALHVSAVYLQAFADPDGNGQADALYFPNRHLPVRADLFSYVAWQLATRAAVKVYAWMPVLAFELSPENPAARFTVHSIDPDAPDSGRYQRLSPFSEDVRTVVAELYEDLARHARFDGLLFHDDAMLDDFEDASEAALEVYAEWGLPLSVEQIRADPAHFKTWSERKSQALITFTQELAQRVRRYQGEIKTARNLYAQPVLEPAAQTWFAQSLPAFLTAYDYTAVMAMPYMEGAKKPDVWLEKLARTIASISPDALKKTVFELQATDWRHSKPIPGMKLTEQMEALQRLGAVNFGYYPDDFLQDQPAFGQVKRGISLQSFPRDD